MAVRMNLTSMKKRGKRGEPFRLALHSLALARGDRPH